MQNTFRSWKLWTKYLSRSNLLFKRECFGGLFLKQFCSLYHRQQKSICRELNPMAENRVSNAFHGKREHVVKPSTTNMEYSSQHIDIEIPYGLGDHVIVPDTLKITFNLQIESTVKISNVVNNVGRMLVKKRSLYLVQQKLTLLIIQTFMTHTRIFTYVEKNAKKGCFKAYYWPMV